MSALALRFGGGLGWDVRVLKALAREKRKTSVIARTLKRSVGANHQKAMRLGVTLGVR